ncbi:hypothetical protein MN116_004478 [Schistosoma mekongi]|uniref:Muscleblind-like protein n=1 Tax=Schistosoma mekongi TaxID=38744 RepID=A0AAE1ZGS8_SCHME|nr:hypothetical protein MN116_004478 [Schistosoma mekongi]
MQVEHICTTDTFTIHCFKCILVNTVSVLDVTLCLDITELQFSEEDNINNKPENNNSTSDIHSLSKLISNSSSEKLVNITSSLQSTSSKSSSTTTVNSQVKNHTGLNDSTINNASRSRRQDWCKWPICIQYRTTGYCPAYNSNATLPSFQMCQAAHIGPNDQVPLSSDGQVRVCFDSMGLVNLTCNRSDCYFYHPPKEIRDKIVAKRHAQYLREKVIRDVSKSRKSTGLLTIDNNRHFDYNTSNYKTILSQNQLTPSPIHTTIHQQSMIPQQFFGTIDILSSSMMNKDNLHNITSDYNVDGLYLTNIIQQNQQQQQQQQHPHPLPPPHHHRQQHPPHQHHQLKQQQQQQSTNLNAFIQSCTTNQSTSCLLTNNNSNNVTSYLSNILFNNNNNCNNNNNNPFYIQQSIGLNPCTFITNTPTTQYSDIMNIILSQNQIDYDKLYKMLLLNTPPITSPIYPLNLTTLWSKLLDTFIINNPSLLLTNFLHTPLAINSQMNCLLPQLIDPILPLNYLPNITYPLVSNSINNTYPTAFLQFNQRNELQQPIEMMNIIDNALNVSTVSCSSSISSSTMMSSSSSSSPSSSSLLFPSNQLINSDILLQNSQFLLQHEYKPNLNLTTNTISTVSTPGGLSTTQLQSIPQQLTSEVTITSLPPPPPPLIPSTIITTAITTAATNNVLIVNSI